MTHNEPQCFIGIGLQEGRHAPGDKLGLAQVLLGAHHALLAHGKAVQAIRASSKLPAQVGIAMAGVNAIPASQDPQDIAAAYEEMGSVTNRTMFSNTWWMDPMFFGRYPEDGLKLYGEAAPSVKPGEMETIRQPLDFLGINQYTAVRVRRSRRQHRTCALRNGASDQCHPLAPDTRGAQLGVSLLL